MLNHHFYSLKISGLDTNVNFLIDLARHPSFQAADVHTGFIDQHFDSLFPPQVANETALAHAVAAIVTKEKINSQIQSQKRGEGFNPFAQGDSFRLNHAHIRNFKFEFNGKSMINQSRYTTFFCNIFNY